MALGALIAAQGEDDSGGLHALAPLAGRTLIEYQARLLIRAGASQIIVLVARLTPELLGAISRIARRGVTVDAVRQASEAAAKLHPLARVLMLADGLITTERVVAGLAVLLGLGLLPVLPAGVPVLAAALAAPLVLFLKGRRKAARPGGEER